MVDLTLVFTGVSTVMVLFGVIVGMQNGRNISTASSTPARPELDHFRREGGRGTCDNRRPDRDHAWGEVLEDRSGHAEPSRPDPRDLEYGLEPNLGGDKKPIGTTHHPFSHAMDTLNHCKGVDSHWSDYGSTINGTGGNGLFTAFYFSGP